MNHSVNNMIKLTAVISVMVIVVASLAPTVYASEDDDVRTYTLSEIRDLAYGAEIDEDSPIYGMDPITIGIVVGLVVYGVICAAIGALAYQEFVESPYDDEQVNTQFSAMESEILETAVRSVSGIIASVLPQDADLWFFTTDYWTKIMEYMVYDAWTPENDGFDAISRALLFNTGLVNNAANYLYTWSNTIDTTYNHLLDRATLWTGEEGREFTSNMEIGFAWNGGSIVSENGGESSTIGFDLCQTITISEPTVVYLDMNTDNPAFDDKASGTIYNFSGEARTIYKVDSPSAGTTFTLEPGSNNVTSLPSGTYLLPAGTYAGPFISLIGEDSDGYPAGTVEGALVLTDNGTIYLFRTNGAEENAEYTVYNSNGNEIGTTTYLYLTVKQYDGTVTNNVILGTESGDGSSSTYIDILYGYYALVDEINRTIQQTYEAGEATWTIFDACEESDSSIHPSSIVINTPDRDLTSEEYLSLYLTSMAQIHDYAQRNGTDLDGIEITTSVDSLDLVCYGSIYVDGESVARDVIFSPYVYTVDQTWSVGSNTFVGTGSAIIWTSETDFDDWNGQMILSESMAIPLEDGYVIEVEKIIYKGDEVDHFDFERSTISAGGVGPGPDWDDDDIPDAPGSMDLTMFYLLIITELGIIVFLVGRIMGVEVLMLAGIVVIAIGIMIPQAIEGLLTGSFAWDQLIPFSWL